MHRLTLAVLPVLVWGLGAAVSAQDGPGPVTPSIVTTGEAVVRRAPDQSFVTVSVESRARNPRDAQRQNAETMTAVQQRIAAAGVPKDAVRTLGYNIQQEFDYVESRRVARGYFARNAVEVRVDAIDRTGDILDAAVQAGATRDLSRLAIAADSTEPVVPCGACRQVLAEFNPDLLIVSSTLAGSTQRFELACLLPLSRQGILK